MMQISMTCPQYQKQINSFHNSENEDDLYDQQNEDIVKICINFQKFCDTVQEQDYQDSNQSIYPKMTSKKIEIENYKANNPLKVNNLCQENQKRLPSLYNQQNYKNDTLKIKLRRTNISKRNKPHNTKSKTQNFE